MLDSLAYVKILGVGACFVKCIIPFLIARDSRSLGELFWNLRFEGHPPLWHILLWVITRFTQRPEAMQALHLAMASTTVWLVTRFSPFPLVAKLLFPFGYYTIFEYSVVSRNYQLVLLCSVVLCILWQHRRAEGKRYFIWLGVVLALLSLSHVLGVILGAGFGVMLVAETLCTAAGWRILRKNWWRFLLGMAIAVAGTAWAVKLLIPPPDSSFAVGWEKDLKPEHINVTLYTVWNGLVPILHWQPEFWGDNNILVPLNASDPGTALDAAAHAALYVGLACVLLALPSWRATLFLVVAGSGALAFAHMKMVNLYGFAGATRHHGVFFLAVLMACWIAFAWKTAWPVKWWQWLYWLPQRAGLTALLAVHVFAAAVPVYYSWITPFSMSRQAADILRPKLGRDDILMGPIDYLITPVAAYLPGHDVFLADEGKWRSFAYWERITTPRKPVTAWATQIAAEKHRAVVLVLYSPLDPSTIKRIGAEFLGQATDECIQDDERYFLYRVSPSAATAATTPASRGFSLRSLFP